MSDWLDEMLLELPSEGLSPGLIRSIQAKIERYRRRKERLKNVLRTINGAIALAGFCLAILGMEQLAEYIPVITSLEVEQWFNLLINSPNEAYLGMLNELGSWMKHLHTQMETALILAFILLAVSIFIGLSDFLNGKEKRKGVLI
ncbi:MAG: hypothetical protein A2Z14_19205 [Chloroflexi bacterium RBG_16_48_8]|nr:MAG: hypothetical protein A2Z14_19205 [Chloroflexi bacterium RBG_16_48_8]